LGRRVYQRDDLIDLARKNDRGESSLSLMRRGRAPIGEDGRSIELHHAIQTEPGPVVEVTRTLHRTRSRELHINPSNQLPSGIDRREFNRFKEEYWTRRAEALERGD
jgi:filamentous hemagglutinin